MQIEQQKSSHHHKTFQMSIGVCRSPPIASLIVQHKLDSRATHIQTYSIIRGRHNHYIDLVRFLIKS